MTQEDIEKALKEFSDRNCTCTTEWLRESLTRIAAASLEEGKKAAYRNVRTKLQTVTRLSNLDKWLKETALNTITPSKQQI